MSGLLADISTGNTGFADVMFLVGFILFVVATILRIVKAETWSYDSMLIAAGLAAVALGWLVL